MSLPRLESPGELRLRTWVQLARTFVRMQRQVELALAGQGLTLPQFDVLATLSAGQDITQQELAERLLVTKGNVCGVLDRMATAGWVERRPDPNDGRANRIHLTAAGKRKLAGIMPVHHELVLKIMNAIPDAETVKLRSFLETLENAVI